VPAAETADLAEVVAAAAAAAADAAAGELQPAASVDVEPAANAVAMAAGALPQQVPQQDTARDAAAQEPPLAAPASTCGHLQEYLGTCGVSCGRSLQQPMH